MVAAIWPQKFDALRIGDFVVVPQGMASSASRAAHFYRRATGRVIVRRTENGIIRFHRLA